MPARFGFFPRAGAAIVARPGHIALDVGTNPCLCRPGFRPAKHRHARGLLDIFIQQKKSNLVPGTSLLPHFRAQGPSAQRCARELLALPIASVAGKLSCLGTMHWFARARGCLLVGQKLRSGRGSASRARPWGLGAGSSLTMACGLRRCAVLRCGPCFAMGIVSNGRPAWCRRSRLCGQSA